MNARDGLLRIRDRLVETDAQPETLQFVDTMIDRASAPGAERAQASQTQLIRMLVRSPVAKENYTVYNDLVRLEEELVDAATRRAAEAQAEAERPLPKSRKYYKQLKEKERQKRG